MSADAVTIQSLKAVDAWIDVINANINGGVRTAFKASRLRFAGANTDLIRPGSATGLPLQMPESSLVTANTVIDWTQGAITSSTETTHLAIQGQGFFLIASPDMMDADPASATFGGTVSSTQAKLLLTRDGEFHTDANGFLRTSFGYYLVSIGSGGGPTSLYPGYDTTTRFGANSGMRAIYNDIDQPVGLTGIAAAMTEFLQVGPPYFIGGGVGASSAALYNVVGGKQNLRYSQFGSTVFDFGFRAQAVASQADFDPAITLDYSNPGNATILTKSLEASNSSMTQSVPELSLAQKLFSALTKVLQINQTNTDSVLNLVR